MCMHYVYATVDAMVGFVGKFKKMQENILNLSFEVDTYEEEEGGDDIDSSDSDNDDGDLGEFDPELKEEIQNRFNLISEERVKKNWTN